MNIIDFNDYFIDITFKVIPKKFRHNKIETVDKKNWILIIDFAIFKYMDSESYFHIFKYLHENYWFFHK